MMRHHLLTIYCGAWGLIAALPSSKEENDNDTSGLRQHSQLVRPHLAQEGKCERTWPFLRRDSSSESKHPQHYHDQAGSVAAISNAFETFVVDIPAMRWRKFPRSLEMQMMSSVSPCGKKYLATALMPGEETPRA